MRIFGVILIAMFTFCGDGWSAAARRASRATAGATAAQSAPKTVQKTTTAARAATNARTAPRAAASVSSGGRTTSARAAKPTATKAPVVAARAGTTQKAVNSGTKISTATKNTVVDAACQEKFNGCMDAFCMMDNANGGRCTCSEKSVELNAALAEIEKRDAESYKLATTGVERIEMGLDAEGAIAMAQGISASVKSDGKSSGGRKLDFGAWDAQESPVKSGFSSDSISDKVGVELHDAALTMCKAQIPECSASFTILQTLYAQQIRSDCLAYENTIKKRRTESDEKLQAAESALYDAALEQYQNLNKYDLGQCSAKFKECMQETAGCGDDFSGCAIMAANDNTSTRKSSSSANKKYKIQGELRNVEIYASTYDALVAKKPMCEHVTKQCVDVADQVWDAFLRMSAPEIKLAENIAENDMRQNCIADVSNCFQKACKDNIDPSDPDGSYDMCLSRPETMLNVCKVPLNACGIDASKKSAAQKSDIWQFVLARLASVRVNECTNQIKNCLAAADRCGPDYTNCIGLDMDTIVGLCPLDKLTACDSSEYGGNNQEKLDYVYNVAQGVLLNVDNQLLQACQNAVNQKMMEICGGVSTCLLGDVNSELGRGSLQTGQNDSGRYVISGTIDFNKFNFIQPEDPATADYTASNKDKYAYEVQYTGQTSGASDVIQRKINAVVSDINSEVNRKISLLAMDPTVNMCITGRNISQIVKGRTQEQRTAARFPNLLSSYVGAIYDSLLTIARLNYTRDYAQELSQANSMSREYRNMMMCNAMAELEGSELSSIKNTKYGIIASTDYSVTLDGTSVADQAEILTKGGNRTTPICTGARSDDGKACAGGDSFMIATEERTAVYEPGPQTCRITSRLYACTGYEAIYEGESSSYNVDLGASASVETKIQGGPVSGSHKVGGGANLGFGESKSKTTHGGNFCNSFAEPTISEQIINFSSGEPIFGNVTRGNMQNSYYNSSSTTTVNDNSWGIDLSLAVSDDHSQHSTTTVEGDNATINASQTMEDNSSLIKKNGQDDKKTKCKKDQVDNGQGGCRAMTDDEKKQLELKKAEEDCKKRVKTHKWENSKCVELTPAELETKAKAECDKKADTHKWDDGKCKPLSREEKKDNEREACSQKPSTHKWDTKQDKCVEKTEEEKKQDAATREQTNQMMQRMREEGTATILQREGASCRTADGADGKYDANKNCVATAGSAGSNSTTPTPKPGDECELDGKKGIMTFVGCDISQSKNAASTGIKNTEPNQECKPSDVNAIRGLTDSIGGCTITVCKDGYEKHPTSNVCRKMPS